MKSIATPGCMGIALALFLCNIVSLHADTYTSEEEAGLLFRLQGEYHGVIEAWGGTTWGAQVIAKSKNKVEVHLLEGGLPGQGFKGREPSKVFEATVNEGKELAEGSKESLNVIVKADTLSIKDADGKSIGILTKFVRESTTLGAKPGSDGTFLFEVGGANDFKGARKGRDGLLGVGGTTNEVFEDHHIHLEFCIPFQPNDAGQKRGNSGVYIQGRYELQILDSFGLSGEDNECGGFYQVARPSVNMCYPPLSWQTYDIDFASAKYGPNGDKISNAKVTVKHNGVTIHDSLELTKETPGKDKEGPKPGPLFLQDHGNPVVFRNVWVRSNMGNKPRNIKGKGPHVEANTQ